MATLLLKSLVTGYILVYGFLFVVFARDVDSGNFIFSFLMPIVVWPATLIVSALALLVFLAIKENK
ncbi:hypothetical protein KJ652_06125 [Patescibacteria group bacterium]|nr:hypothetical protein [Patescibacteria group bacterium]